MKYKQQGGQIILFVIVAMTVALSVGITVATRTISSLSRTARSDTSNKVTAAAEAGIERYLALSFSDLGSKAQSGNPETIPFPSMDGVTAVAEIIVNDFTYNSANGNYYEFNLAPDHVKEVSFVNIESGNPQFNGNVKVCWDNNKSAIYYVVYGTSGISGKGIIIPNNSEIDSEKYKGEENANGSDETGFNSCKSLSIPSGSYGLRLRSLYETTNVGVFPSSGNLPTQGFKITSKGMLQKEGKIQTTRTITVYRSRPYMPAVFDTAIYTEGDVN
ncbi:hypothetical protein A3K42_01975 [candidate division WWE3 bacterium RBG_13_37_7]|uniref:Type 4 fimbrial biogenesis protein PilX N-terminal domain-containing protein n=1 Tax=candidate division WWE3 bacterium RBG_13_37_7 TaxID=1802609 RepID=A0A1F4U1L5_UNCKA|nr:MAG: hypothetical protein A3K42_01975 [candidate division WWE3 bacterium RBG_13_37_7]